MNKSHLFILGAFLAGVALSNRVRGLPFGSKIPSF